MDLGVIGLSDPTIPDPTVLLYGNPDSIFYTISVTNQYGCTDTAGIVVKVYKTNPDIFIPTYIGRKTSFRTIAIWSKTSWNKNIRIGFEILSQQYPPCRYNHTDW